MRWWCISNRAATLLADFVHISRRILILEDMSNMGVEHRSSGCEISRVSVGSSEQAPSDSERSSSECGSRRAEQEEGSENGCSERIETESQQPKQEEISRGRDSDIGDAETESPEDARSEKCIGERNESVCQASEQASNDDRSDRKTSEPQETEEITENSRRERSQSPEYIAQSVETEPQWHPDLQDIADTILTTIMPAYSPSMSESETQSEKFNVNSPTPTSSNPRDASESGDIEIDTSQPGTPRTVDVTPPTSPRHKIAAFCPMTGAPAFWFPSSRAPNGVNKPKCPPCARKKQKFDCTGGPPCNECSVRGHSAGQCQSEWMKPRAKRGEGQKAMRMKEKARLEKEAAKAARKAAAELEREEELRESMKRVRVMEDDDSPRKRRRVGVGMETGSDDEVSDLDLSE